MIVKMECNIRCALSGLTETQTSLSAFYNENWDEKLYQSYLWTKMNHEMETLNIKVVIKRQPIFHAYRAIDFLNFGLFQTIHA